jgi:VIT1/CCC1 family predicted Fe2+/Mn2+ transporter
MMKDELGLVVEKKSPVKSGVATFVSFIVAGSIPLVAYVLTFMGSDIEPFVLSALVTALTFVIIGYIKTYVTKINLARSIGETLLLGTAAATVAYFVGDILEKLLT